MCAEGIGPYCSHMIIERSVANQLTGRFCRIVRTTPENDLKASTASNPTKPREIDYNKLKGVKYVVKPCGGGLDPEHLG